LINRDEYENEIIDIRRVSKVTKGGRNLRFRVTMVVGDRKGNVGVGVGSTREIPRAIQQAIRDAKKNMVGSTPKATRFLTRWSASSRLEASCSSPRTPGPASLPGRLSEQSVGWLGSATC
jgi:small subunit ribosomal protein S5